MKRIIADTFLSTIAHQARRTRHPDGVTFELTYGCNLRCVHCFNPTHRALPRELSTSEVLHLLDELAMFGVLTVTFTGGEPVVRPDIHTILLHARSKGLLIRLLTNATRVNAALVSILQECGVEQICVSIYGATAATYERMTGISGSYTAFLHGLTMLAESDLPVVVRMPVTSLNSNEVDACRGLTENLGRKFQYSLDVTSTVTGDLSPLQYRLPPEKKMAIDRQMLAGWGSAPMEESACSPSSFIECACGHTRFAITPYGEMNLCTAFPIPRYDLRTGTVREGWEALKQIVDEARPTTRYKCPTCDVRPYCRQGRNDAWLETGDMSTCLPHFKEWAELEHRTHALLDPRRPG